MEKTIFYYLRLSRASSVDEAQYEPIRLWMLKEREHWPRRKKFWDKPENVPIWCRGGLIKMLAQLSSENTIVVVNTAKHLAEDPVIQKHLLAYIIHFQKVKIVEAISETSLTSDLSNSDAIAAHDNPLSVAQKKELAILKRRATALRQQRQFGRRRYGITRDEMENIYLMRRLRKKPKGINTKRMSYGKIADELNAKGIHPRAGNGGKWWPWTVARILNRRP